MGQSISSLKLIVSWLEDAQQGRMHAHVIAAIRANFM